MEAIIRTSDKKIFQKILEYVKSMGVSIYEKTEEKKDEDVEWTSFSANNIARAYAVDEPDYQENMVKEPNASYERR